MVPSATTRNVANLSYGTRVSSIQRFASGQSILIVPVLFVIITRASYGKKELDYLREHHGELMERERKIEQQKIDPELEYEMTHHFEHKKESG